MILYFLHFEGINHIIGLYNMIETAVGTQFAKVGVQAFNELYLM